MEADKCEQLSYNSKKLPGGSFFADIFSATFVWIWKFCIFRFGSLARNTSINSNDEINGHLPKPDHMEHCTISSTRLQEIFQHEETVNGSINISMLRVVWQFCKIPLLAASLVRLLSTVFAIAASLALLYDLKESVRDHEPYSNITFHEHYSFIAYFLCTFCVYYMRSASNWLSLRIATRLRTACLTAAYTKLVESALANRVSVYQMLNLTAGDNELILQSVQKASTLLSHTIGISLCIFTTMVLSATEGLWNMLSIIVILVVSIVLVTISNRYFNHSMWYLNKKMSILDEFCRSFGNDDMLSRFSDFSKRFSSAISAQYLALSRAEVLRNNFPVDVILILLGSFLVLLVENSAKYMVLVLLNVSLTPILMFEWCEALNAVLQANQPFEKVKAAMICATSTLPEQEQNSSTDEPVISITEATFHWSSNTLLNGISVDAKSYDSFFKLLIDGWQVPKGHVVGITGATASGKSSLIAALLGHMQIASGHIVRNGKMAYFPEKPYVLEENSVRHNVIFYQQFDAGKYDDAMALVHLGKNGFDSDPICENIPIEELELTQQQLQKINLARALYCDRDIIILNNPLSTLTMDTTIDEIFQKICAYLVAMGKTVIVASQNDNILRHCHSICLIIDGKMSGQYAYEKLRTIEMYQTVLIESHSSDSNTISNYSTSMIKTNDLKDTLVEQTNKLDNLARRSIRSYCMIFGVLLMHLFTNFYCISMVILLIFKLIGRESFHLFSLIWLSLFRLITASYMYKALPRLNKRIQRTMFQSLRNASLEPIKHETEFNRILHSFMESHIAVHQTRFTAIRCWAEILAAGLISIPIVHTVQSCIIMLGGMLFYSVTYYACRATVYHYAKLEKRTRGNLLRHLTSQYNGRAVIQSFDRIKESHERMYRLIEENSTAVFLRMSTHFFAQFMCHCLQLIPLACLVTLDLNIVQHWFTSNEPKTYFILMFIFLRLTNTFDQMLECYFDDLVLDQKITDVHSFVEKSQTNEPDSPKLNRD